MKAHLLSIFLCVLTTVLYSQNKTVTINNHQFIFKNVLINNDSGNPTKQIEIYRNKKKLLTHTISEIWGDCNSESVELGRFEINNNTIIFYTYWAKAGDAPTSPYGVRKQVYTIDSFGNLMFLKGKIYVETFQTTEFLFSTPKNEVEKNELQQYIAEVEKEYKAKFVSGKAKQLLFTEVKGKLKTKIQSATKNWKLLYSDKLGSYKI